jgi:vacuolar-type H+-ATPase subunit H
MAQRQTGQDRDPMALAIERVLEAERAAEATLASCRQQAEALVAAARERAAAITRRVDTRISRLHAAYLNRISTEVASLADAQISSGAAIDGTIDDAKLIEAAQRLAANLTRGT